MNTETSTTDVDTEIEVREESERGASLVEYALLIALIAVVCIVALTFIGEESGDSFMRVGSSISEAN